MGKIARSIARVHHLTTDNLIDGAKASGRAIKSVTTKGIEAVKVEHAIIEQEAAAKKRMKAAAKAAVEAEQQRLAPKHTTTPA